MFCLLINTHRDQPFTVNLILKVLLELSTLLVYLTYCIEHNFQTLNFFVLLPPVGIAGVFRRKRSALNIPGVTQSEIYRDIVGGVRRSLRLRKTPLPCESELYVCSLVWSILGWWWFAGILINWQYWLYFWCVLQWHIFKSTRYFNWSALG